MRRGHYCGDISDELLKCQGTVFGDWASAKKSTALRELRRQRIRSANKRVRVKPQVKGFGR